MKTSKKYTVKYLANYSTTIDVDGENMTICFSGANTFYGIDAQYTTTDKKIQDAIEASSSFKNGKIVLAAEIILEPDAPRKIEIIKAEEVKEEKAEPVREDGTLVFDRLQDLQTYLQKNYTVPFAEIRSRTNALAKADSLGLKYELK